jgi:hypothetical protein
MRRLVTTVVAGCLATAPLGALLGQTVVGRLVDRVGAVPLEAAFVSLLGETDHEIARSLTDASGRFSLTAAHPGVYRLRSKLIGFRPVESAAFRLEQGSSISRELILDRIALNLAAIVVEGDRECDLSSGAQSLVLVSLWDEIREALHAVAWTTQQKHYWFNFTSFERYLTPARRVTQETTAAKSGFYERPFRSAAAETLAQAGYIVREDRDWLYFAPDADVLLGDPFLATHCFEIRVGRGNERGLVGLNFAPVPSRKRPDIAGALWVDSATSELRYLEYKYTALPRELWGTRPGGRVSFKKLPSGAWIVQDWMISMPRFRATRGLPGDTSTVIGIKEAGGQVIDIKETATGFIQLAGPSAVEGIVFDSISGMPLANALVAIQGTTYSGRSDTAGRFRIAAMLQGEYGLVFNHPLLDSIGVVVPAAPISLRRGGSVTPTLFVPSLATLTRAFCPHNAVMLNEWIVKGKVRDSTSREPLINAQVHVSWQAIRQVGRQLSAKDMRGQTFTDEHGEYIICGVPAERSITLSARTAQGGTARKVLHFGADSKNRIRTEDLYVSSLGTVAREQRAETTLPTGFEERRRASSGWFVTRAEFEPWSPASVSTLLARAPMVRIAYRGGKRFIDTRRGRASIQLDCAPVVVLDGHSIGNSLEVDIDEVIPIQDVVAIEVYSGGAQIPARFRATGSACGLIAIWSGR